MTAMGQGMETANKITYKFSYADGKFRSYTIETDGKTKEIVSQSHRTVTEFTKLQNHQCSHCPLNSASSPTCPIASNLEDLVIHFKSDLSYKEVNVMVTTKERSYGKRTSIQEGLHSIMGFIMATSGCPHMSFLKPMARFHLPFSTVEETLIRTISFYLLGIHFRRIEGDTETSFDLDELNKKYEAVSQVNHGILERMKGLAKADGNMNSILILNSYAQLFSQQLRNSFDEIRKFFSN